MNKDKFIENLKLSSNIIDEDLFKETLEISQSEVTNFKGLMNLIIVMEELGELQQCISKFIRFKDNDKENDKEDLIKYSLLEELADNYIGIKYVQLIAGISDEELNKAINVKIQRQHQRALKYLEEKDNELIKVLIEGNVFIDTTFEEALELIANNNIDCDIDNGNRVLVNKKDLSKLIEILESNDFIYKII